MMMHSKSWNETELSKYVWNLQNEKKPFQIKWKILKKCKPYSNISKKCSLCLNEKFIIICKKELCSLNRSYNLTRLLKFSIEKLLLMTMVSKLVLQQLILFLVTSMWTMAQVHTISRWSCEAYQRHEGDVQKRRFQFTQVHLRVKKSSTAYQLKIERKTSKTKKVRMHTFSNRSKSGSKTTDLLGKSKQANISKEWRGSNWKQYVFYVLSFFTLSDETG